MNCACHAVIVLTDGIDSGRGSNLESALQALIRAQVTVYVVSNSEIARAAKKAELDTLVSGTDATVKFNQLHIEDLREGLRVLDISEQRMSSTGLLLRAPLRVKISTDISLVVRVLDGSVGNVNAGITGTVVRDELYSDGSRGSAIKILKHCLL